jgi:hypothetical protein
VDPALDGMRIAVTRDVTFSSLALGRLPGA